MLLLGIGVLLLAACDDTSPPSPPAPTPSPLAGLEEERTRRPGDAGAIGVKASDDFLSLQALKRPARQDRQGQRIAFEHLAVGQEPLANSVFWILQDHLGFIWIGTAEGLYRYDGLGFKVYQHDPDDPHSLSENQVFSIAEDYQGVLWVGTYGGGLERFDREEDRFVHYQHDPADRNSLSNNKVFALLEDPSGGLWVGTSGGGLNRYDRETDGFIHYRHDPDDPDSLASDYVNAIHRDRSGGLWVGTTNGLDRRDPDTGRFMHNQHDPENTNSLSNNQVFAVVEDHRGVLWIGTSGGGLNRLDPETGQFTHFRHNPQDPTSLGDDIAFVILEDQDGVLWVGSLGGGLHQFNRETEQFTRHQHDPADPESLSSDYVNSLFVDQAGILWIGTAELLDKYDRQRRKFSRFLDYDYVQSVMEDQDESVWVGTLEGLHRLNKDLEEVGSYRHYPEDPNSLSSGWVLSIYQDSAGALWVGTSGGGINRLDRETGRITHYRHDASNSNSLSNNTVNTIYEDSEGGVWAGTDGGLNLRDPKTDTFRLYVGLGERPETAQAESISAVIEDTQGILWVGTWGDGLKRLDRETGRFQTFRHNSNDPSTLSTNFVSAIFEDSSGRLWFGTDAGLHLFDRTDGGFTHYGRPQGLQDEEIRAIQGDRSGNLWVSTRLGLSQLDPETGSFANFDVGDGLTNRGYSSAAAKRRHGEMLFGGTDGIDLFFPERIKPNPFVPPVALTALRLGGNEPQIHPAPELVRSLTLTGPQNELDFEFAALSYTQPEKNQHAYQMEGYDSTWHHIGTNRTGHYEGLPGGSYTLRLKGSNDDGVWNEEGTAVRITVVPPVWSTWWFPVAAVLVVGGLAFAGYRLRVRNIQAQSRALEDQVAERTREIERRRHEMEALYRADEELYRYLELDQVLQSLVDIAVDMLKADKSSVFCWDDRSGQLVMRVARGFDAEATTQLSFSRNEGLVGEVAATGQPAFVENSASDRVQQAERPEIIAALRSEAIRAFMLLPIIVNEEVFGIFNVNYTVPHAFGRDEERLFAALSGRAARAIENAQLYEQTQELAALQERSRLARDLHDAVTQTLFSASLIAEALPELWDTDQEEGRQLLGELRQLNRGALAEMRTLLLELRPATLVEANLGGLLRQLGEAVAGRTGIPVSVTVRGQCSLPSDVHVAIYRITQEALNNVVKHARATQAEVKLSCTTAVRNIDRESSGRVELEVRDNGRGFDPDHIPPDSLGLGIIRERTQAIGARLEINSQIGVGTQIVVAWSSDLWQVTSATATDSR